MNTTEGNKLIAEFMGLKIIKTEDITSITNVDEYCYNPRYHSSWDWLMPVVHKCLYLCHDNMWNEWENSFADKFTACFIDSLYKETVEFIKWYNNEH